MKRFVLVGVVLSAAVLMALAVAQNEVQNPADPPALGIQWAKGFAHVGGATSSPDMTWNGGLVMPTSTVHAIFWGRSWATSQGDKIAGMDSFYAGFGGSNYAKTSDEYSGANGQVTSTLSYGGHTVDTSMAAGGNRTSSILKEVCKVITNPVTNGYYPVYTDLKRSGNYCAYHSWGSCGGVPIQFAFFWNLDGDAGCDPQSTVSGQSQGLAALANVSAHEISEARTDPRGTGWFDSAGAENGDKCAWTFGASSVALSNGTNWKLQGEWSNAAYDSGSGYPNNSGQKGCLGGN